MILIWIISYFFDHRLGVILVDCVERAQVGPSSYERYRERMPAPSPHPLIPPIIRLPNEPGLRKRPDSARDGAGAGPVAAEGEGGGEAGAKFGPGHAEG